MEGCRPVWGNSERLLGCGPWEQGWRGVAEAGIVLHRTLGEIRVLTGCRRTVTNPGSELGSSVMQQDHPCGMLRHKIVIGQPEAHVVPRRQTFGPSAARRSTLSWGMRSWCGDVENCPLMSRHLQDRSLGMGWWHLRLLPTFRSGGGKHEERGEDGDSVDVLTENHVK